MTWELNRAIIVCGTIALAGIAHFVYSTALAIDRYDDYSITNNFLSDLGRTKTSEGVRNDESARFFNRAVIALGLSLVPFFAAMPTVLTKYRGALWFCGVSTATGLIGIGLTPYDLHFVAHHVALGLWLGPMLIMMITFFASFWSASGKAPPIIAIATFFVVVAALSYALAGDRDGHVIFQKVLAVLAVIWFCLVFLSVSVSTIQAASTRRQLVERQALQYLEVMKRNPRRRSQ